MRKRYPAYKPSGVEWLGDVPEHWQVKRLKYAALRVWMSNVEADERKAESVCRSGAHRVVDWTSHTALIRT